MLVQAEPDRTVENSWQGLSAHLWEIAFTRTSPRGIKDAW